jgi:undecaprenyl-diphosphatase
MDYQVEQWINAPAGHTPFLDQLMIGTAAAGEYIFIAIVVLWFAYGWWWRSSRDREGALGALLAAAAGLVINAVIAAVWFRARPFVAHPATVHLLVRHATDASFPSDHAVAAFAIGAVLVAFHRRWGTITLLFAALLCYARVYVGDHYPGDVLAGALIGTLLAVLLVTVARRVPVLERQIADWAIPPHPLPRRRPHVADTGRSPAELSPPLPPRSSPPALPPEEAAGRRASTEPR